MARVPVLGGDAVAEDSGLAGVEIRRLVPHQGARVDLGAVEREVDQERPQQPRPLLIMASTAKCTAMSVGSIITLDGCSRQPLIVVTGTSRAARCGQDGPRAADAVARATTHRRSSSNFWSESRHQRARTALPALRTLLRAVTRAAAQFCDDRRHRRAAPRAQAARRARRRRVRRARRPLGGVAAGTKGPTTCGSAGAAGSRACRRCTRRSSRCTSTARGSARRATTWRRRSPARRAARRRSRHSRRGRRAPSPRSRTAASARPRWSTSRGSARPSSRRASAPTRALYVVTLTTRRPGGELTPLKFSATTEQLSSLVAELKQAVRQVEVLCE